MDANLFERIADFGTLLAAWRRARRGKAFRPEILEFGYRAEANLLRLRRELLDGSYRHGSYREFVVCDSKRRLIKAAPFRDRVVHHALCMHIEPVFERSFIADSYACRLGKGTHAALKRLASWLPNARYCLACDVSKYFANINHSILLSVLQKKIRDERVAVLCREIIRSSEDSSGRGIPIGNLTSQLFANAYLSELDHFVKHVLHVRQYIRYMDDFLLLHDDKQALQAFKEDIGTFLRERLALTLHPRKTVVFPVRNGVDFLGYRFVDNHRRVRTSTARRFVRRVRTRLKELHGARQADLAERAARLEDLLRADIRSWREYAGYARSRGLLRSLELRLGIRFPPQPNA